jgi:hypothetical protein
VITGVVKANLVVTIVFLANCSAALSQSFDKSKPSGRACIGVVNSLNGDEEALRARATAGPHQKVVAHLDATAKCEALVAMFARSGQVVPGWRPQFVDVTARNEVLLPRAPVSWTWEKDTGPFEASVLFLAPGSKDGGEIRALVNAMQGTRDEAVLRLQGNKLRELIGRAKVDKAAAQRAPKPDSEVAGTMRMVVGFEWRDSARAVNFSADKPGALIFPAADGR